MSTQRTVVWLNGCEEEVRLLTVPYRGYAYLTRDGRMVARGRTDAEAYEQLARYTPHGTTMAIGAGAQQRPYS